LDSDPWIADYYFHAIAELAKIGTTEVLRAKTQRMFAPYLALLPSRKGFEPHGRLLVDYSEDERLDIEF
jgi:hypothetical protein